jgi:hypothetical protein
MKNLGTLHHFLGVAVQQCSEVLFLSQKQYALDVLERAGMSDCKPCSTPVDTHAKVSSMAGTPVSDPTQYRSLVGALQYLTFTRPDISYAVQQVCLHMHDPQDVHLLAIKRKSRSSSLSIHDHRSACMLIGLATRTLASLPQATPCSSVTTSSPGLPSGRPRCLAPALRPNTELLPMVSPKLAGSVSC